MKCLTLIHFSNTKKSSDSDDITFHLSRLKVPYEVRHLKVGDYLWVARGRRNTVELVLPYVIERKRIDDFGSSIKDGRYKEQKFRLQQSGVQNIVYLIESFEDIQSSVPAQALRQATINTLVQCGMQIKFTESLRATAHYLSCMSQVLYKQYNVSYMIFSRHYTQRCVRKIQFMMSSFLMFKRNNFMSLFFIFSFVIFCQLKSYC